MLGQTQMVIIDHMYCRVGKVNFLYQHIVTPLVGVELHLVIVLTQGAATQCPRHQVVLGMPPSESILQGISASTLEGLYDSHAVLHLHG